MTLTTIEKTNIAMPGFTPIWRYDTIDLETMETISRVSPHQFEYDHVIELYELQERIKAEDKKIAEETGIL